MSDEKRSPEVAQVGDGHDELRAEIRAWMAATKSSQADVARLSDVKYGTLTPWMTGKYAGDAGRVADELRKWLAGAKEAQAVVAALPREPGYLPTETAACIIPNLQFAQLMPAFVTIVGSAGVGKTMAAEAYQARTPNVWMISAEPSVHRCHHILEAICGALGIEESRANRLSGAIQRRVKGTSGLIILDEAQFADPMALQQLRIIQNKARVGVALIGNETVRSKLGYGDKSRENLSSRVGKTLLIRGARTADIAALLDAWGVTDDAERKYLCAVAKRSGALRTLTWTLKAAGILATGAGEARALKHIKAAAESMTVDGQMAA